jgi:hypothetical protein
MRGSALLPYALGASDLISSLAPKVLKDSVSSSIGEIKNSWNDEVNKAKQRAQKAFTPEPPPKQEEPLKIVEAPKSASKTGPQSKSKVPKKAPPKAVSQ